ncbi:MAG: HAD family phosphatase [Planctomycetota bacterium]
MKKRIKQKRAIRAVVFDMDGVLFDTEPMHIRAWQKGLASFGHAYKADYFLQWVGHSDEALATSLAEAHGRMDLRDAYLVAKRREMHFLAQQELKPFPGVLDAVQGLSRRVPLGVATSSQRSELEYMLSLTNLAPFFRATVAYNDVAEHKPHPEPFLAVARRLGVPASACAALEDSPNGVRAAREAGMTVLAVTSTFSADALAEADRSFAATAEACAWLATELGPSGAKTD